MSHVTKEEFDKAIGELKESVADIKENHLDSIEGYLWWFERDINRIWKALGGGIALLALVLVLLQVFG